MNSGNNKTTGEMMGESAPGRLREGLRELSRVELSRVELR
jgi:hypothetical protein